MSKDVPFVWTRDCMDSFYNLRQALICAQILAFPTETDEYILDTDASNYGIGGVLSQIQNEKEQVIAYCSRALRPSQRRYCTAKREMLAVVVMISSGSRNFS
jgi:phospholipid-translocating ATPase